MYLECDCTCISPKEWENKMKGARRMSYSRLRKMVRENLPELYNALALDFPNPYWRQCKMNEQYYILVHSGIEYFIKR